MPRQGAVARQHMCICILGYSDKIVLLRKGQKVKVYCDLMNKDGAVVALEVMGTLWILTPRKGKSMTLFQHMC